MKYIIRIVLTVILAGLLFSCNPDGVQISAETAASDLVELRSLLSGVDASLGLLVDEDPASRNLSRAITPSEVGLTGTPEEVYGTGTDLVRFPSDGYFQDYYNSGDEAYFTMEVEDATHYRVKLYIYPSVNFDIKYNYEEYLVTLTDWTNMNDALESGKLSKYETYFADGTVAVREITYTSTALDDKYDVFSVPDIILGSTAYEYPATIVDPVSTYAGTWSSKTESTVDVRGGSDISAVEYYTEDIDSLYSGVAYLSTESSRMWKTSSNTVVRFSGNPVTGESKERSLTTISSIRSKGYTSTISVDIELVEDRISFTKELKLWYEDASIADDTNISYHQKIVFLETGINTNVYEGTVADFEGSGGTGNKYNISLKKNSNGSHKFGRSGWKTTSRAVSTDDLELTLTKSKEMEAVFINIPIGNGSFYGIYEHGFFVGVYSAANGQQFSASIGQAGISIDGVAYTYSELM
jgi:hypothetical protein